MIISEKQLSQLINHLTAILESDSLGNHFKLTKNTNENIYKLLKDIINQQSDELREVK